MAFARLSATTITQSGTDTDLSAMVVREQTTHAFSTSVGATGTYVLQITDSAGVRVGLASDNFTFGDAPSVVAASMAIQLANTDYVFSASAVGTILTINWNTEYLDYTIGNFQNLGVNIATRVLVTTGNGVTRTFTGEVATYSVVPGFLLKIDGTMTIDPRVDRLEMRTARFISVSSGGTLIIGGSTTIGGFERFHDDVAISNSVAQPVWFGSGVNTNNNGIGVESGGRLNWISGIMEGPFGLVCLDGSSVWIRNGVMKTYDTGTGRIDPQTGVTAVSGSGTFDGGGTNRVPIANRGFIGYFLTPDIRIENYQTLGGGEHIFNSLPTGNNSISGTPNGILGYTAQQDLVAIFPRSRDVSGQAEGLFFFTFDNLQVSGSGNTSDLSLQSINNSGLERFTNVTVTNAAGGTALNCLAAEQTGPDPRNRGAVAIYRDLNFNVLDGITESPISGGRYFMIDTDNGNRQNRGSTNPSNQGFDFDQNFVYSDTFTSGSLTNGLDSILLGAVQSQGNGSTTIAPNSNNIPGSNILNWRMDIRGLVNTLGNDTFAFHLWHPEYNYFPVTTSLSEGSIGTFTQRALLTSDPSYSNTVFTDNFVTNLDQLYDTVKQVKVLSEATVVLPTSSTLFVNANGTSLNLGTQNFFVTQGSNANRFSSNGTDLTAFVGTGNVLNGNGGVFNTLLTTGSTNLNFINLSTTRINSTTITNLPISIPANAFLQGLFTTAPAADITYTFDASSDVSNFSITNTSSNTVNIIGKAMSDFATLTGNFAFPIAKTIVVTLPTVNTIRSFRAEYGGVDVTSSLVQGTDGNGDPTFTYTTLIGGDFDMGIFVDGFNYTQLKLGSAESGTFGLIPIPSEFLDFSTSLGTLAQQVLDNSTGTFATGEFASTIAIGSVTALTGHAAVTGQAARLLVRRLLENSACIDFLLSLTTGATEFFTYDTEGWIIANSALFEINYNADDTNELQIFVYPKDSSNNPLFVDIVPKEPQRGPVFPPEGPVVINQTTGSLDAFRVVVDEELDIGTLTKIGRPTT